MLVKSPSQVLLTVLGSRVAVANSPSVSVMLESLACQHRRHFQALQDGNCSIAKCFSCHGSRAARWQMQRTAQPTQLALAQASLAESEQPSGFHGLQTARDVIRSEDQQFERPTLILSMQKEG